MFFCLFVFLVKSVVVDIEAVWEEDVSGDSCVCLLTVVQVIGFCFTGCSSVGSAFVLRWRIEGSISDLGGCLPLL